MLKCPTNSGKPAIVVRSAALEKVFRVTPAGHDGLRMTVGALKDHLVLCSGVSRNRQIIKTKSGDNLDDDTVIQLADFSTCDASAVGHTSMCVSDNRAAELVAVTTESSAVEQTSSFGALSQRDFFNMKELSSASDRWLINFNGESARRITEGKLNTSQRIKDATVRCQELTELLRELQEEEYRLCSCERAEDARRKARALDTAARRKLLFKEITDEKEIGIVAVENKRKTVLIAALKAKLEQEQMQLRELILERKKLIRAQASKRLALELDADEAMREAILTAQGAAVERTISSILNLSELEKTHGKSVRDKSQIIENSHFRINSTPWRDESGVINIELSPVHNSNHKETILTEPLAPVESVVKKSVSTHSPSPCVHTEGTSDAKLEETAKTLLNRALDDVSRNFSLPNPLILDSFNTCSLQLPQENEMPIVITVDEEQGMLYIYAVMGTSLECVNDINAEQRELDIALPCVCTPLIAAAKEGFVVISVGVDIKLMEIDDLKKILLAYAKALNCLKSRFLNEVPKPKQSEEESSPNTQIAEPTKAQEKKPYLGLEVAELPNTDNLHTGVTLVSNPAGPCREVGLRAGDVICAVGGRPTPDINTFISCAEALIPGSVITMMIQRSGVLSEVKINVGCL